MRTQKQNKGLNGYTPFIVLGIFIAGQVVTGLISAGSIKTDVKNIDRRLTKVEDKVDVLTVNVAKLKNNESPSYNSRH